MQKTLFTIATLIFSAISTLANAAPVTFTHSAMSNGGSLDGVGFGAGLVTITATADTDDINEISISTSEVEHLTATIDIDGVGVFDIITSTRTFVNNGFVGFSRSTSASRLDLLNGLGEITGYELLTSVGPESGPGSFLQWATFAVITSGGVLEFATVATTVTFTAVVSDIPLPAALPLFLARLAGLGFAKRKNKGSKA